MPLSTQFFHPRYWPTWLQLALMRFIICFPMRVQYALGRTLGRLLYRLVKSRRRVVETNIALCFPDYDAAAQRQMAIEVFENNAIGFLETAMAWWSPDSRFENRVELEGYEHIEQAQAEGKGVILVGAHYSTLDLGGFLLGQTHKVSTIYRPHNNPLLDHYLRIGRNRFTDELIDNRNTRQVIRLLKVGKVVWLAPDQDMGPTNSIYAPFFGLSAATVPTVSRLARLSKARVMIFGQYRTPDNNGYKLTISEPLESFPSGDEQADTARINAELEHAIREYPTQYMWVHRRFKTHPKGKNHLYKQGHNH